MEEPDFDVNSLPVFVWRIDEKRQACPASFASARPNR